MKTSAAKTLINEALTTLMGFKTVMSDDSAFLAIGVKTGQISATQAAMRILETNKEACRLSEKG